jgi:flagella basal body P-ring formation protein FlgA
MRRIVVFLCWVTVGLSLAGVSVASEATFAALARAYSEETLQLPGGSVETLGIDPAAVLPPCAAGWAFSFPYQAKTTVAAICRSDAKLRRYVGIRLPSQASQADGDTSTARVLTVVAVRDLDFGHVLTAGDVQVSRISSVRALGKFTSQDAVIGKMLTRPVRTGEPIARPDLRRVELVRRDQIVQAVTLLGGARISVRLQAKQSGAEGDVIDVANPESGRRLRGRIQPDGTLLVVHSSGSVVSGAKVENIAVDSGEVGNR